MAVFVNGVRHHQVTMTREAFIEWFQPISPLPEPPSEWDNLVVLVTLEQAVVRVEILERA